MDVWLNRELIWDQFYSPCLNVSRTVQELFLDFIRPQNLIPDLYSSHSDVSVLFASVTTGL